MIAAMTGRKHRPKRMCIACRTTGDKRTLYRLVRLSDGQVAFDPGGKMPGRGAYVCGQDACIEKVLSARGLLTRALKIDRFLSTEELQQLKDALSGATSRVF